MDRIKFNKKIDTDNDDVLFVDANGMRILRFKFMGNPNKYEVFFNDKRLGAAQVYIDAFEAQDVELELNLNGRVFINNEELKLVRDVTVGGSSKSAPRKGTYEAMTVKELKDRCAKRGIKHSGLKKSELIAALRRRM